MDGSELFAAAAVACLAALNVGLWTLRVALAARSRRRLAALVSGVDAVLFVATFHLVLGSLDDPVRVAAYAVGVAGGTHLGLAVEALISPPEATRSAVVSPRWARRWLPARSRSVPARPCVCPAAGAARRSGLRAAR